MIERAQHVLDHEIIRVAEELVDLRGEDLRVAHHVAGRAIDDDLAFVEPWGFDLASIDVPVTVWQGSADLMVPFAHGEWLAAHVPGAQARLLDGDGHLSIVVGRAAEIVDDLLS